ncbi:MAG TPA: helix-turn-helix transcriptional regulator [Rubricoccaceae bacterium]|jgi:DNA-binding transcriptional regulator YiaG
MDWTPERIRALRLRLHLDQEAFADALGFGSSSRVSELENGKRKPSGSVSRVLDHLDARGPLPSPS